MTQVVQVEQGGGAAVQHRAVGASSQDDATTRSAVDTDDGGWLCDAWCCMWGVQQHTYMLQRGKSAILDRNRCGLSISERVLCLQGQTLWVIISMTERCEGMIGIRCEELYMSTLLHIATRPVHQRQPHGIVPHRRGRQRRDPAPAPC